MTDKNKRTRKPLTKLQKRLTVIGVIAFVLISLGLYYVFKPDSPPEVVTAAIENGSIRSTIETTGTVSSGSTSSYPIADGVYVKEVFVSVGSLVNPGDPLATFDVSGLYSELAKKRNDYNNTVNSYNSYLKSVADAKVNLPAVEAQIAELEPKIEKLKAEVAASEAEQATATTAPASTQATTAAPSGSGSFLDELGEMISNIADIKGTISDLNNMMETMRNMGNMGNIDISSIMAMSSDTPETKLMQYQLQLIQLNSQKLEMQTLISGQLDGIYESLMQTALAEKNSLESTINSLSNGWVADGRGVVTEVSVTAGTTYSSASSGDTKSSVDVSAVLSALTSGGDAASLLSSLLGNSSTQKAGMVIENYDGFYASFTLDKYNLQEVHVGQSVLVTSVNDKVFDGQVSYVAATATESSSLDIASIASSLTGSSGNSSSALAKVSILNPDSTVVVGFDVDLAIITNVVDDVPVVPVEAVRYDDSGMYVWILDAQKKRVTKSYVTFGASEDTKYELVSGAAMGDTIIVNPPSSLEDGQKVTVKKS